METSELTIKIRLSGELQQQLSVFQQVRQARTLDESVYLIIQEYFRLMSPQITQDLIPFQSIWTTNILLQQGTLLAQIQQCIHNLNQVVQQQEVSSSFSLTPKNSLPDPFTPLVPCKDDWSAVGLSALTIKQGTTGTKLAERIGVSPSAISRKRSQPDFQHWTQARDPHKVAWEYRLPDCRFHPIQIR